MSLTAWTTRYSQIHRPTFRGRLRHAALSGLAIGSGLLGSVESALKRPRVHFVYLHHVFDDEIEPFRELVHTLCAKMRPIDYSDGVERVLGNRIDRPYVTFSFDDGMKNCLKAAKVLDEFGARACFFVCPDIVGERDQERLERFSRERLHLPPLQFMDWNDLESLQSRGHEIGNHTRSHVNLKDHAWRGSASGPRERQATSSSDILRAHSLVEGSLDDEIAGSLELLRSRLGASIRHFAWPYGHFDALERDAIEMAFASGHRSCASGQRGAHVVGASSVPALCVRRDHVIAAWPKSHVLYLLARSARRASDADNDWPAHLR